MGPRGRGRAAPPRRALLEAALSPATRSEEWTGRDVTVAEIERELAELRVDTMDMRTSVMTHLAWAPPEWQERSRETLAGMAERHPSRTVLLFPQPEEDGTLDAELSLQCFPLPDAKKNVCSEVIELRLHRERAHAPASIVLPLVLPDLPVFLRWRGRPEFGGHAFEQLVDVVDRLVVDSLEWPDAPECFAELVPYFERVAVSDIAWTRTLRWRRALAQAWPFQAKELHVRGPEAEAALLAGWLRARTGRAVALRHEAADRLELLALDGRELRAREERLSASDLLSHELDRFSRDPVYEAAVREAA